MSFKVAIHNENSEQVTLDEYTKINLEDLSEKQNASLKEIFVGDYLCFLDQKEISETIDMVVSKMRYGAKLIISGYDIIEICRTIMSRELALNLAREFLYSGKISCYTHWELVDMLQSRGLKISRKILEGPEYTIIMERPDVAKKE